MQPGTGTRPALPWRQRGKTILKHTLFRALAVVRKLGKSAGNAVLLTFDDGPDPEVTRAVLERLKKHHARAIFFVVGRRIRRAPELLETILEHGHLLGNHTYEHPRGGKQSWRAHVNDVVKCQELVERLTGWPPVWFRPPLGRTTVGSLLAPKWLGLRTMYWSVDCSDWQLRDEADAHAAGAELAARVGPGDIVLLHDDNPCVLTVLDHLLPALAARGCDLSRAVRTM